MLSSFILPLIISSSYFVIVIFGFCSVLYSSIMVGEKSTDVTSLHNSPENTDMLSAQAKNFVIDVEIKNLKSIFNNKNSLNVNHDFANILFFKFIQDNSQQLVMVRAIADIHLQSAKISTSIFTCLDFPSKYNIQLYFDNRVIHREAVETSSNYEVVRTENQKSWTSPIAFNDGYGARMCSNDNDELLSQLSSNYYFQDNITFAPTLLPISKHVKIFEGINKSLFQMNNLQQESWMFWLSLAISQIFFVSMYFSHFKYRIFMVTFLVCNIAEIVLFISFGIAKNSRFEILIAIFIMLILQGIYGTLLLFLSSLSDDCFSDGPTKFMYPMTQIEKSVVILTSCCGCAASINAVNIGDEEKEQENRNVDGNNGNNSKGKNNSNGAKKKFKSNAATAKCRFYCPICMMYGEDMYKCNCCNRHCCSNCLIDYITTKSSTLAPQSIRNANQIREEIEKAVKDPSKFESLPCIHCQTENMEIQRIPSAEALNLSQRYHDSPIPIPHQVQIGDGYDTMTKKLLKLPSTSHEKDIEIISDVVDNHK